MKKLVVFFALIVISFVAFSKNEITVTTQATEMIVKTRLAEYHLDLEKGVLKDVYLVFSNRTYIYKYDRDGFDLITPDGTLLTVTNFKLQNSDNYNGVFDSDVEVSFEYQYNGNKIEKVFVFEKSPYYSYSVSTKGLPAGFKISLPRVGPSEYDRYRDGIFVSYYSKNKTMFFSVFNSKGRLSLDSGYPIYIAEEDFSARNYMGPVKLTLMKSVVGEHYDWLKNVLSTLPKAKSWYDPIFYGMVEFLGFFYRLTGNYGWAIIIFTIIVRLVLYPLYHLQTKSMIKMRQIQPKIEEIRKKYKDPQRQQQELMKLYKEEGANPASGCLTILIQFPIFILLFTVIRYYSEAFAFSPSFLIWQDLSVGGFSQNILLVLIDILAVAYTSLISSTDMRSARQSVIMGVIFPFLFITFPTGLFLYYTVGSIIQLGITYYVYKKYNIKGISLKEFFGLSK
jgi:YidC/Oxa1 family membrane protein insertase